MKNVEIINRLLDMPTLADIKIRMYGDCGKVFEFDIKEVTLDKYADIILIGKNKEKRETGIEPVARERI